MATVSQLLMPEDAQFLGSAFPSFDKINGTNYPVARLLYDATSAERAYWKLTPFSYGSGSLTADVIWYAVNATSGAVVWETALAAITPDTDSQDVETKSFATANTVADSHLGTTSKRLHKATVTISNLDSLAVGDEVWLRVSRLPADAGDTMLNDAALSSIRLSYST